MLLEQLYGEDEGRQRECIYYMSAGYLKLKEYKKADQLVNKILEREPKNSQALDLKNEIKNRMNTGTFLTARQTYLDGMIGLALVGGLAAVGFGLLIRMTRSTE